MTWGWPVVVERVLIQASIVRFVVRRKLLQSGTTTESRPLLKLNADPTSPGANVAPLSSAPLFVPAMSPASPSPGHQPTRPEGGGIQFGGCGTHLPALPAL